MCIGVTLRRVAWLWNNVLFVNVVTLELLTLVTGKAVYMFIVAVLRILENLKKAKSVSNFIYDSFTRRQYKFVYGIINLHSLAKITNLVKFMRTEG